MMPKPTQPLFRKSAVANKGTSLFAGSAVTSGVQTRLVSLLVLALTTLLVVLLIYGTYERRERVLGYVTPTSGLVRIIPPRIGVVTQIEVSDGEEVSAGQPLLAISSLRSTNDGGDAAAALVNALERERLNIQSRITRETQLAESRSHEAERRIKELRLQSGKVESQRALAAERAELLDREVERLESLQANAHVSASLLDQRRGEALDAQKTVTAFVREFETLQSDIAALQAELELVPLQLGARQDELGARLLEIERMLTEAEVQRETVVRAPVSGRVTSLVAFPGQSVTPAQAMLAILPDNSRMQAVLFVPSQAAGFIRTGQEVRLRYDAFPHQRFGVYRGTVESVSRTMLNPGDEVGPLQLQGPAYRVTAKLDSEAVMAYGESIPLQPDMTLQADVVRERMRIIEWIFDPVRAAVSAL
jgi:membrane fusion protein